MKYFLFGDIHGFGALDGEDFGELEQAIEAENPDGVICLGDFDLVETIHRYMDLEKRLKKEGRKVITVPGNHDHALLNGYTIGSTRIEHLGFWDSVPLRDALNNDLPAKRYLERLVGRRFRRYLFLDRERFSKGYPTSIVHGAYDGESPDGEPFSDDREKDLWNRLIKSSDHSLNFKAMKKAGRKVMIRGHDHSQIFASLVEGKIDVKTLPRQGKRYLIEKGNLYTISPGAAYLRKFAVIDTAGSDCPIVTYHRF